jgi:hypothetical protein
MSELLALTARFKVQRRRFHIDADTSSLANELDFIGGKHDCPQLSPPLMPLRVCSIKDGFHLWRSQT